MLIQYHTFTLDTPLKDVTPSNFRRWCYEKYKLYWLLSHNMNLSDLLMDAVRFAKIKDTKDKPECDVVHEWEKEYRTSHKLYPDVTSFLENEYRMTSFMVDTILNAAPMDVKYYKQDVMRLERNPERLTDDE